MEQGKLMEVIYGGLKFQEMKIKKFQVHNTCADWNLARYVYLGNTYCVWKCKKMYSENLIIGALKRSEGFNIVIALKYHGVTIKLLLISALIYTCITKLPSFGAKIFQCNKQVNSMILKGN